jgi:hypothetical protein
VQHVRHLGSILQNGLLGEKVLESPSMNISFLFLDWQDY